jgi:endoglucanase
VKLTRRLVLLKSAAAGACGLLRPMSLRAREGVATTKSERHPAGGINLAGAEFGKIPGAHGREYLYPPRKHFDYFRDLGFTLIRLPFKWERLQPELNAPFAPEEQALLAAAVRHATGGGQQLIIDPHNFAKRRIAADGWATEHSIGSNAVPITAFADFWSRLSTLFKDDERVVFGLMNEPVGIKVDAWLQVANAAIVAIRETGATNLILVPGIEYSGAHSWHRLRNTAMAGVVDPINRFAFDVHQYFDRDSSGTKPDAMSGTIGSERIEAFQDWARQNGFKAVLGEFNGGRNRTSYNALNDLCQEMSANTDVWLGWAAWAGGPRWPDDEMFNLEPWRDGRTREQTAILAKYARPQTPAFWVADGAAIDLDFARGRLYGAPSIAAVLTGFREENDQQLRRGFRGLAMSAGTASETAGQSLPPLELDGALLSLLQEAAFTLVIETRDVALSPAVRDILSMNGAPLLRRAPDGALEAFDTAARTAPQPLRNWQSKRRIAVAFDRRAKRLAIGVTGVKSVQIEIPALPDLRRVMLGGAAAIGAGTIIRITGYREFRNADALDALLA